MTYHTTLDLSYINLIIHKAKCSFVGNFPIHFIHDICIKALIKMYVLEDSYYLKVLTSLPNHTTMHVSV